MNTKVKEALGVINRATDCLGSMTDPDTAASIRKQQHAARETLAVHIAQQDATIARMREALQEAVVALAHASLGDDTYRAAYVAASQLLARVTMNQGEGK